MNPQTLECGVSRRFGFAPDDHTKATTHAALQKNRVKILFTEGSSLSARQTLFALAGKGHVIDVCDPKPFRCLARYSRFVRRVHRCPSFATRPLEYLRFLVECLRRERYDVLLPVHDQVFLLSRFRQLLPRKVGLALPDFDAMRHLQSKAAFVRFLESLKLPYPPTTIVKTRGELQAVATFPCYVKLAHSTAGCGVWRAHSTAELHALADQLDHDGQLDGRTEILVQQPAPGVLAVVQSVFQHGRLVAGACYQARALGVGGSARARVSVSHPLVMEHLQKIGAALSWHGALMFDYIYNPQTNQPAYIDASPRIGETLNATLSGVNLCELLVRVSLGEQVQATATPRIGVKTHSAMMSLMAAALHNERRWPVLREVGRAMFGLDVYAGSQDELTRPGQDWLSLVPAAVLAVQMFVSPQSAKAVVSQTVNNYALSETAARVIHEKSVEEVVAFLNKRDSARLVRAAS